jgi:hypothetical protein
VGFRRKLASTVETKAAKRIAGLATPELAPWVEQCLYQIGRSLADWSRDGAPEHVLDAVGAAEIALEILQEIRRRVGA